MDTQDLIRQFIAEELLLDANGSIEPDRSLIGDGVLNSLALIRLIAFLEERFGVTVGDGDVTPDRFDTIHAITAFVHERQ